MKQVKRFYDSVSGEDRWQVHNVDKITGESIPFDFVDLWDLRAHGFTILTPVSACNDTFIDYTTHRIMAHELNR